MGHVVYCRTYSSGPVKTKVVFLKRQGDCYTTFGLYRVWHLEIMPIFSDKFSLLSKGKKLKLVSKKCMVGSTGRGWGDNCYRHCFGRRRQKLQHRKLEILIYRYITKNIVNFAQNFAKLGRWSKFQAKPWSLHGIVQTAFTSVVTPVSNNKHKDTVHLSLYCKALLCQFPVHKTGPNCHSPKTRNYFVYGVKVILTTTKA